MMLLDWKKDHKTVDMNLTEKQLEGMIIMAVLVILFYFIADYLFYNHHCKFSLGFIDKNKNTIVVEIISSEPNANGIYFLPEKTKVSDALNASGITNIVRYRKSILDTSLAGAKTINVGSDGTLSVREMSSAKKLILDIPLNINQVTSSDLVLIRGIGEKTAGRIVGYRRTERFNNLEDLMKVNGVKEKKFAVLKKYFCVDCP